MAAYYTLAHSIDDASTGLIIEAVNEPPGHRIPSIVKEAEDAPVSISGTISSRM